MSTAGDTDSVFSDAEAGPREEVVKRKRDRESSVTEIVDAYEKKQRKGKSPKNKTPPGKASPEGRLSPEIVSCIKNLIENTIQSSIEEHLCRITESLERKIASQQQSIEVLEGELFNKAKTIDGLEKSLGAAQQELGRLAEQVDDMERHQRGVNLVLSSKSFGVRVQGEDIRAQAVLVLNASLPQTRVSSSDFAAAHRLGRENTVIVAFHDRSLRNLVYQQRLQLGNATVPVGQRLYISESLTRSNRELHGELLTMKSEKLVWTVFTNNGIPGYKLTRDSLPIRVTTVQQIKQLWQQVGAQQPRPENHGPPAALTSSAGGRRAQYGPPRRPFRPPAEVGGPPASGGPPAGAPSPGTSRLAEGSAGLVPGPRHETVGESAPALPSGAASTAATPATETGTVQPPAEAGRGAVASTSAVG